MHLWRFLFCMLFLLHSCKQSSPPKTPIQVSAVKIEPHTIPQNFEYIGVAESSHIVELRARVEGYLEKITYKEGSLVKDGDLMFVIDQRPFIAALESATGVLERQKALLWNAEKTKARMVPLYKENAVSQRDFDNAIANELAAQANVETANANVYQAQLNLGFASIAAPVTGMSSQAKFREGALISPGPNSLLTTIYVVDPIWVNFSISESDLLQSHKDIENKYLEWPKDMNFKIEAILSDGTVLPSEGYIDFTNPAIQQSTGTMLFRSVIPNPSMLLHPGQFVRVVVKGAIRPNAILVPQSAVVIGQKGPFVYVIDQNNRATIRFVEPGNWYENYWVINKGLKAGDIVIAEGVNRVQDNTWVNIQTLLPSLPKMDPTRGTQGNSSGW